MVVGCGARPQRWFALAQFCPRPRVAVERMRQEKKRVLGDHRRAVVLQHCATGIALAKQLRRRDADGERQHASDAARRQRAVRRVLDGTQRLGQRFDLALRLPRNALPEFLRGHADVPVESSATVPDEPGKARGLAGRCPEISDRSFLTPRSSSVDPGVRAERLYGSKVQTRGTRGDAVDGEACGIPLQKFPVLRGCSPCQYCCGWTVLDDPFALVFEGVQLERGHDEA